MEFVDEFIEGLTRRESILREVSKIGVAGFGVGFEEPPMAEWVKESKVKTSDKNERVFMLRMGAV